MSTNEINYQLSTALRFTPDALEANRAGRLSDSQLLEVRHKLMSRVVQYSVLGIIPVVLIAMPNPSIHPALSVALYASLVLFIVGWSYRQ